MPGAVVLQGAAYVRAARQERIADGMAVLAQSCLCSMEREGEEISAQSGARPGSVSRGKRANAIAPVMSHWLKPVATYSPGVRGE